VTRSEAIQHFKTITALACALGISKQAVAQWGETVPTLRQQQIEILTMGALKADFTPVNRPQPSTSAHFPVSVEQALRELLVALNAFNHSLAASSLMSSPSHIQEASDRSAA